MRIRHLSSIIIYVLLSSCSIFNSKQTQLSIEKFEQISLGKDRQHLLEIYGPGEEEVEPFTGKNFAIITYYDVNKLQDVYFTFDPITKQMAAKSMVVYSNDKMSDLNYIIREKFQSTNFKKLSPCETRGFNDHFYISRSQGAFLAIANGVVVQITYATTDFIDYLVEQLYLKCPRLQPKKE